MCVCKHTLHLYVYKDITAVLVLYLLCLQHRSQRLVLHKHTEVRMVKKAKGSKEGAKIIIIFKMKTRLNGKAGDLVLCLQCVQCHSHR